MNFHTPKASNPRSQLPSLTSFRGIAALWVVFYHYSALYLSRLDASPYTHLIEKGYLAVDMFFMLSGFVLTHVYRETFSESIARHYKGFLLSRVARLYPLHILVLLLFVATVFTSRLMQYTVTGTFQTIPLAGPRSLTAFIANLFMLQGLSASQLSWNYPAWSISVEFVAYLLFPFILPTIWRASTASKITVAVFLIGLLGWFAYVTGDNFNQWDGPQALLRCLPEFLLGTLLYSAFHSRTCAALLDRDGCAIVIALTTILALHFGASDIMIVLLFAVLILSAVVNTGTFARIASLAPFIWLGNISYSLYLLHGLIQFAVTKVLSAFGVASGSDLSIEASVILLILMVTASLASAATSYYGVEIIWRRYLRELFGLGQRHAMRKLATDPQIQVAP